MPIGILNPSDVSHSTSTRPADATSGVNQRRWYSDALGTLIDGNDFNAVIAQIRHCVDFWAVTDVENDDTLLRKAIQQGAGTLTGNIQKFQALVGGPDKVAYFTSVSAMSLFTATAYSRDLMAKSNQAQWRDALGVSAVSSGNVVAFGALVSAADKLPYFTGFETMDMCNFLAYGRGLVGQADAAATRTYLGLGTAAVQPATAFATPADVALKANINSPTFTGIPAAPTPTLGDNTTKLATTAFIGAAISALALAAIATSGSANDLIVGTVPAVRLPAAISALHPLTPVADRFAYYTSATVAAMAPITTFGRSLIDDADNIAARTTLGLGTAAVRDETYFAPIASPIFTGVPAAPTPVAGDNTTRLATTGFVAASFAPLVSPALTGNPTAPTQVAGNNSTRLATTAFVVTAFLPYAPLASPALTGVPIAPTAAFGVATDQIATTSFVANAITGGIGAYAPLASPVFTGDPTVPTPVVTDNDFSIANTAFVQANLANYALKSGATFTGAILATALTANAGALMVDRVGDAATANVIIRGDAGQIRDVNFQSGTLAKFTLRTDAVAEGGSNVGSNFAIIAYDDAGTSLGNVLTIARATRILTFNVSPTAPSPTAGDNTTKLATTAFVATSFQPLDAELTAIAGLVSAADRLPYYTGVGTAALATFTVYARTLLDDLDAATARATLGLAAVAASASASDLTAGTLPAARLPASLSAIYVLTPAADQLPYYTGASAAALASLTPFARTLLDDVDAATARATLGLGTMATEVASNYAPLAGATFTGSVTSTAFNGFIIDRAVANRDFRYKTSGVDRWALRANSTAEAGTNTGSNFQLVAFDDTGVSLGNVFTVARDNQVLAFVASPTAPTPIAGDNTTKLATTAFVATNFAALAGATFTGAVTATTVTATLQSGFILDRAVLNRDIRYKTSGLDRWIFRANATAESGANAGSDFQMLAFDDAGVQIGGVFTVARSSQVLAFVASPTAPTPAGGDSSTKLATTAFVAAGFQPLDAELTAIAGLVSAADRLPYYTGANTAALAVFTTFGRSLVDDADAATARATLGLGTMATEVAANYAPLVGATFTGSVISSAATAFALDRAAGSNRDIKFRTAGVDRWSLRENSTAEGGSNAGTDFQLVAYDDAGASLGNVFTVTRATRILAFPVSPTAPTPAADDNTTKVATTEYVQSELTAYVSINNQVGTTVTVSTAMYGALTTLNNAGAQTCALPSDATLAVPVGTKIDFMQIGAGQCTFSAGAGATVTSRGGLLKTLQWGIVRAIKRAVNTWVLSSDGLSA